VTLCVPLSASLFLSRWLTSEYEIAEVGIR